MQAPEAAATEFSWTRKEVFYVLLSHFASMACGQVIGAMLADLGLLTQLTQRFNLSSKETATVLFTTFVTQVFFFTAIWQITPGATLEKKLPWWGFRKCTTKTLFQCIFFGAAMAILFIIVSALFPPNDPPPMEKLFVSRGDMLVLGFNAVLFAPFIEEIFFRGILFSFFREKLSLAHAVIYTSIFFTTVHVPQMWPYALGVLLIGILGTILAMTRAIGHSTTPAWLVHLVYNAVWCIAFLGAPT